MRLAPALIIIFMVIGSSSLWAGGQGEDIRKILISGETKDRTEIESKAEELLGPLRIQFAVARNNEESEEISRKMNEIMSVRKELLVDLDIENELKRVEVREELPPPGEIGDLIVQQTRSFIEMSSQLSEEELEKIYSQDHHLQSNFWDGLGMALQKQQLNFNDLSLDMFKFLLHRLSEPPPYLSDQGPTNVGALTEDWSLLLFNGVSKTRNFDVDVLIDIGVEYHILQNWYDRYNLLDSEGFITPELLVKIFDSKEELVPSGLNALDKYSTVESIILRFFRNSRTPSDILTFKTFLEETARLASPKLIESLKSSVERLSFNMERTVFSSMKVNELTTFSNLAFLTPIQRMEIAVVIIKKSSDPQEISQALDLFPTLIYNEFQEPDVDQLAAILAQSKKLDYNQLLTLNLRVAAFSQASRVVSKAAISYSSNFDQLKTVFDLLRDSSTSTHERETRTGLFFNLDKAIRRMNLTDDQIRELTSGVSLNSTDTFMLNKTLLVRARTFEDFRGALKRLISFGKGPSPEEQHDWKIEVQESFLANRSHLSFEELFELRKYIDWNNEGHASLIIWKLAPAVRSERQLAIVFSEVQALPLEMQETLMRQAKRQLPLRFRFLSQTRGKTFNFSLAAIKKCGLFFENLRRRGVDE